MEKERGKVDILLFWFQKRESLLFSFFTHAKVDVTDPNQFWVIEIKKKKKKQLHNLLKFKNQISHSPIIHK